MSTFLDGLRAQKGLGALATGNYAKAEAAFRKMAINEPDSLQVLHNLGLALMAQGKRDEAERCFRREEKLYGLSYVRHCALADLAYSGGRRTEAMKRYKAALECPESAADRPILEARLAVAADQEAFRKAGLAAEAFARGETARAARRFDEALAEFAQAMELDPTAWPAANNSGTICLNDLKDPARALEYFGQAMRYARPAHVRRNAELAGRALEKLSGSRKSRPRKDPK